MEISSLNLPNLDDDDLFCILDQLCYNEKHNIEDDKIILKDVHEEYKQQVREEINFCHKCKSSKNVIEDAILGIAVCKGPDCGTVISTLIDTRPEWKSYDNGEFNKSASRCSMPLSHFFPQSSLGTSISGFYRSNIKKLHSWSAMPYRERSLYIILKEIESVCRKANILKCIEDDAKILCKNISECKHTKGPNKGKKVISRGRNRRSLMAACVFFACRRKGMTRSPKEIATIFSLKNTEITRGCKLFIKLMKMLNINYNLNSSASEHFIPRFCYKLHIKESLINQTLQIAKNIQKLNVASVHTPLSIATGAILLMSNINKLNITGRRIATHFDVTEVTVFKTYNKLLPYKKILVNDPLTNKLSELMEQQRNDAIIPDHVKTRLASLKKDNPDKVILEEDSDDYDDSDSEIEEDNISDITKISNINAVNYSDLEDLINNIHLDLYEKLENIEVDYENIMTEHKNYKKN